MSLLEITIIGIIVLGIGLAVWRGGQANPQGTGTLGRDVTGLSTKVSRLDSRVGHVEKELEELQQTAATTKDIARIEERIQTVRAEMQGHAAISTETNASVRRIERVLIERGLGK